MLKLSNQVKYIIWGKNNFQKLNLRENMTEILLEADNLPRGVPDKGIQ